MEKQNYKKLIKIDDKKRVTHATTSDFASGDDWIEVGEHDDRIWYITLTNEHGIYLYEYKNKKMVSRDTTAEDSAVMLSGSIRTIDAETARLMTAGYDTGHGVISTSEKAQLNHALTLARIAAGDTSMFPLKLSTLDGNFIIIETATEYKSLYNSLFDSMNAIRAAGIAARNELLGGK